MSDRRAGLLAETLKIGLLACALAAVSPDTPAASRWQVVSAYDTSEGVVKLYLDPNTVVSIGKYRRGWVLTDYPRMRQGTWDAPPGHSKGYFSTLTLWAVDCRTKDMTILTSHSVDAPMGRGQKIWTDKATLEEATFTTASPESPAEELVNRICAVKLRP